MKKCPYCAEEIQDEAVVCKHCGRDLRPGAQERSGPVTPPRGAETPAAATRKKRLGCVPIALIVLVALYALGKLGSVLNPPSNPSTPQQQSQGEQAQKPAERTDPALQKLKGGEKGTFGKHTYEYKAEGDRVALVYTPELPGAMNTVTAAIRNAVQTIYGKNISKSQPRTVERPNGSLLAFDTLDETFFVLLGKDEKGRVIGYGLWREIDTSPTREISARVNFTGTQIEITNQGPADWRNVELDINGGLLSSGYTYRFNGLALGETAKIGALNFANSDGQRFNPFQVKPQKMQISVQLGNGKSGTTIVRWQ